MCPCFSCQVLISHGRTTMLPVLFCIALPPTQRKSPLGGGLQGQGAAAHPGMQSVHAGRTLVRPSAPGPSLSPVIITVLINTSCGSLPIAQPGVVTYSHPTRCVPVSFCISRDPIQSSFYPETSRSQEISLVLVPGRRSKDCSLRFCRKGIRIRGNATHYSPHQN